MDMDEDTCEACGGSLASRTQRMAGTVITLIYCAECGHIQEFDS